VFDKAMFMVSSSWAKSTMNHALAIARLGSWQAILGKRKFAHWFMVHREPCARYRSLRFMAGHFRKKKIRALVHGPPRTMRSLSLA
jgi:hypothetical protein